MSTSFMAEPQMPTTVTYRSGTDPFLGTNWDVMHVVYKQEDHGVMRIANSVVLARSSNGTIIRKTDIVLDRWEQITDEEVLRACRKCFDERDRMAAELCKCGHSISAHDRSTRDAAGRVDAALLPERRYDIFSDKAVGESGCRECSCSRWIPASY